MRRIILLTIVLLMLCNSATEPQSPQSEILIVDLTKKLPENPYQEEYERMLYPTVRIRAGNSTGSGVIIHHKDTKNTIYILSAGHVVGNNSTVTIELFYPKNIELEATVIITDTIKDLALLSVLCPTGGSSSDSVAKARLAPVDYRPYIFTPVYSVGCSLGLIPRPSQGIISVITDSYWEITSPILPGNSGGPVYDAGTYEIIGIAVWIHTYNGQLITTMAGIVPVSQIYEFLEPVETK